MAKDILLTEEEQAERIKEWWKSNGSSVITGCVLGVALVIGVNYWRDSRNTASEEASVIYNTLASGLTSGQGVGEAAVLDMAATLRQDYSRTPYASKAALIEAREHVEQGRLEEASAGLRWAMENTGEAGVIHAARLRLARIEIEEGRLADASALLLLDDYQGFDSQYHELLGDIALLNGDNSGAKEHYSLALDSVGDDVGYGVVINIKRASLGVAE